MKRLAAFAFFPVFGLVLTLDSAPAADKVSGSKAALQAFNDYIGSWSGDGKGKGKVKSWAETVEWGWRFKGSDCWLTFKAKGGQFIKSGELKWLPDKKTYQFTGTDQNDNKVVLEGTIDDKGYLTLTGTNPKTKEPLRLTMFNAGDGAFFNYRYQHARPGAKFFVTDCEVSAKKEGVAFAKNKKGPVCIVSGGLGTMAVTYKGTTYYVCCGGCRDAFNETPEKYIKEFEAKKGKK